MPSAEESLYTLLATGSPNPVTAIVGDRVHSRQIPQNPVLPFVRFFRISTPRGQYRTLDGTIGYASPRFQIDCWATSDYEAITLAQAVYQHLEAFRGTVAGLRIDAIGAEDEGADLEEGVLEGGSDAYRQRLDFIMHHAE